MVSYLVRAICAWRPCSGETTPSPFAPLPLNRGREELNIEEGLRPS